MQSQKILFLLHTEQAAYSDIFVANTGRIFTTTPLEQYTSKQDCFWFTLWLN